MSKTVIRPVSRFVAVVSLMALAACQPSDAPSKDPVQAQPSPAASAVQPVSAQPALPAQATSNEAPLVTFHLAQLSPLQDLVQVKVNPDITLYAVDKPLFTQADLQRVSKIKGEAGEPMLRFDFNEVGATKLAALASEATGHYLMVSVRGQLIAISRIAASYPNGTLTVPAVSESEASAILQKLR